METDYSKYDLAELRESVVGYKNKLEHIGCYYSTDAKSQLGSNNHPVPLEVVNAVTRLHNAMTAIDRDAVVAWLERFDYIYEDPIECVASTKTALNKLREGIRDYKDIARKIDPDVNSVRRYCINMANWLGQQIPILKERRRAAYAAPTDAEKEMLKDLLEWDIEEWLDEYLFSDADLAVDRMKRILRLALNTDGIDERKRERLNQVLAQLEQEITKVHQGIKQADKTSNTIEKDTQNHAEQKKDSHQQRQTKKKSFTDIIQYKEEGLTDAESKAKVLNRLHELIDGKRGAKVGATLLKAQQDGLLITCPTQAEFEDEFKLIGTWQAIHNYMSDNNPNALELAYKIIIFSPKN